jgi:hypothetical protein
VNVYARHQQGDAILPHHANTLGITFKGLQFKPFKIKTLELFSGIRHGFPMTG